MFLQSFVMNTFLAFQFQKMKHTEKKERISLFSSSKKKYSKDLVDDAEAERII